MAKNNNLTDFLTGVADAIRAKKGTSDHINPQDFESEIENIQTGVDTADATATSADIRVGKTAYVNDEKVEGSIQDYNGESEPEFTANKLVKVVDGTITELTADDLRSVTKIRNYLFYGCEKLVSITIPDGATSIGNSAFNGCSSLTSITIPNSVTSIGNSVFYQCGSLASITMPDGVTKIEQYSFYYCSKLTNITMGNGVTSIDVGAFRNCDSLTSITIPNSVTSISTNAFYDCRSLTSITILATTPPSIQSSVFSGSKINKIIVPAGCGDAYKSATNWSEYADYIEEESE